jgi:hypothetical protein
MIAPATVPTTGVAIPAADFTAAAPTAPASAIGLSKNGGWCCGNIYRFSNLYRLGNGSPCERLVTATRSATLIASTTPAAARLFFSLSAKFLCDGLRNGCCFGSGRWLICRSSLMLHLSWNFSRSIESRGFLRLCGNSNQS